MDDGGGKDLCGIGAAINVWVSTRRPTNPASSDSAMIWRMAPIQNKAIATSTFSSVQIQKSRQIQIP